MFWQEDEDKSLPYQTPDDVVDALFSIRCKQLPLDHAWALQNAVLAGLVIDDKHALGIHHIHVAESSNGWNRPDETEGKLLYPSRRTKLIIRAHQNQLKALQSLCDSVLSVDGHELAIGKMKTRLLTNSSVVFSRHVVCTNAREEENAFLERCAEEVHCVTGIRAKKMMCGKSHQLSTPDGPLFTRHLMIADLDSEPSIQLQQTGLGTHRNLGCGIFLPHKGIKSLNAKE